MTVPELNDDQCTAILQEALNRGMFESPGNIVPADPAQRNRDASELVGLVMAAAKNGKDSENVNTILFLAQVDMKPPKIPAETPPVKPQTALSPVNQAPIKEIPIPASMAGFDITQITDGVLENLIEGVEGKNEAEYNYFVAEKARRNEKTTQVQDEPQGKAAQEITEQAGEAKVQSVTAPDEVRSEDGTTGGIAGSETGDASAFARVQTPETSKEAGSKSKEPTDEENERRVELEKQLTMPMIKAHGIDIVKLGRTPISKLEDILANPEGPSGEKMPVEVNPVTSGEFSGGNPVVGAEEAGFTPAVVATKEDLGLEEVEAAPSEEREKLESLITGPMLKVFRRGRKEIPNMGDNELRFMILNPDGQVSPQELSAAKYKDGVTKTVVNVAKQKEAEIEAPVGDLVKESEQDRTITEAAQQVVAERKAAEEPKVILPDKSTNVLTENDIATVPIANEISGQDRALEIIQKENMPVPKDLEQNIPDFPNDVSKVSDVELFSLHAIYYACEARANWILSAYEDELGDIEKLRRFREVEVAESVPLIADDGKRVTNEQRDVKVASDSNVLEHLKKEHEIGKIVKRIKVLRDNYRSSVSVCSRQYSMRSGELKDIPR